MVAAGGDVALFDDIVAVHAIDGRGGVPAHEHVVMPYDVVAVPEETDVGEGVVVFDDVGEVDCGFAAVVVAEVEVGGGVVVDNVDVRLDVVEAGVDPLYFFSLFCEATEDDAGCVL